MRKPNPWLAWSLMTLAAPAALAEQPWYEKPEMEAEAQTQLRRASPEVSDDLPHPQGERQKAMRQRALRERLHGQGNGKVHKLGKGQYVELGLEREDKVFVILVEFGNQVHPVYGNPATNPGGDLPGPLHNQIVSPDRTKDNTTIWQADYSREHFENLYFSTTPGYDSVANYYRAASSGRYTINGVVTDWVKVPYNEARYGHDLCGGSNCSSGVWPLISDAIHVWTQNQIAAGKTPEEISAYLATFDTWDRYDYDGDGDFNEPDGYIDHFQIVHAGMGEEVGGGAQGANAVWSHRWFAYSNRASADGPGPAYNQKGGTRFAPNVDFWVGDYTMQPENGGLGVFAHEYGHDLGLPDQYDTTNLADNSTGFWSIMSSGSYLNDGTTDIGSRPGDFFAWDKLQLGWLNYDEAFAGKRSNHTLGPAEWNSRAAQGLLVHLPLKPRPEPVVAPVTGTYAWQGGQGNNLDVVLVKTVKLPKKQSATLSLQTWFDTEEDWDYGYISLAVDDGDFVNLASSVSKQTNPNGNNLGNGMTGASNGWVPLSFDLSAYAGHSVTVKLRYKTDPASFGAGFLFDDVRVTTDKKTLFFDGAESGADAWDQATFRLTDGQSTYYENYYLAEYRSYLGYDKTLQTGPYNYGFSADGLPKWAERYAYNEGLLVTYWDTSMSDNKVYDHPGEGRLLPVDARPIPLRRADGRYWSGRVQIHDATFGVQPSLGLSIKPNGQPRENYPSMPAEPIFNDLNTFWYPEQPYAGVKVPHTGTIIEVVKEKPAADLMKVRVYPASELH
ncbi:peptidase M6 [Corallococcus sp. H22C18031201]|nr:peptidase M6 [Corallococcus sp. H22C18031201]